MSIEATKFGLSSLKQMEQIAPAPKSIEQTKGVKETPSFSNTLKSAMTEVNDLQLQADRQIEGLVLKEEGVTTHDAMIALEKADVAFQLMNTIRSKIIRAYEEVMRTQV